MPDLFALGHWHGEISSKVTFVYSKPAFRRMQISEPGWDVLNFRQRLIIELLVKSGCVYTFRSDLSKKSWRSQFYAGISGWMFFGNTLFETRASCIAQMGPCPLRHGTQNSIETILACHPALSTKWLDWVVKWCERWRMRTGPIRVSCGSAVPWTSDSWEELKMPNLNSLTACPFFMFFTKTRRKAVQGFGNIGDC